MPTTITCACGRSFTVREEDVGGEAYCPSCTRACPLPDEWATVATPPPPRPVDAGPPKAAPPRPRPAPAASVFSAAGSLAVGDRVIRTMPCPHCRAELQVRVNDVGGVVYCAACTLGVPIGDSLVTGPAPSAPATGVSPPPARSGRWLAVLVKAAASVLLAGAAAFGAYYTWRHPDELPFLPASWRSAPLGAASGDGPAPASGSKGDAATRPGQKKAQPPVTLALIEELLTRGDVDSALVDARNWEQMLIDQGAGEGDKRRKRLAEVIPRLEAALLKKEGKGKGGKADGPDRAPRESFRKMTEQLRAALKAGDLADAQAACRKIDALLAAHPKELAALRSGYLSLKGAVRDLDLEKNGPGRLKALLGEAERLTKKGDVPAALLAKARAEALGMRIPGLSADEVEALRDRVKQLAKSLRFARGKRALDDARTCLAEGDARTRDLLVKEANDLLSDQPTSDIEPMVKELKRIAARPVPRRPAADFRRKVDLRLLYEKALEHLAAGRAAEAIQACREARSLTPVPKADATRLADLVFEALTPAVQDAALLPDKSPALARARRLLDDAAPWQGDDRWKALDAELRRREAGTAP